MEKEVSAVTTIGVAMCTLAALISIVILTVRVGDYIKASAYNKADDIQIKVESGTLRDLRGVDKEMSVAAIFGIIQNGDDFIGNIDVSRILLGNGWGTGKTKDESMKYLQNNIAGRARLAVNFKVDYGYYTLELHKVGCKDIYNGCTCR